MTAKIINFPSAAARKRIVEKTDEEVRQMYIAAGFGPDGDSAYWWAQLQKLSNEASAIPGSSQ